MIQQQNKATVNAIENMTKAMTDKLYLLINNKKEEPKESSFITEIDDKIDNNA